MSQGWVYIARHKTLPVVKIGGSLNPGRRVDDQGMDLILAVASPSPWVAERVVHGLLAFSRYEYGARREWFHLHPAAHLFPEAIHQAVAEQLADWPCQALLSLQRVGASKTGKTRSPDLLALADRSHRRSMDRRAWREIFGLVPVRWQRPRDERGRFRSIA